MALNIYTGVKDTHLQYEYGNKEDYHLVQLQLTTCILGSSTAFFCSLYMSVDNHKSVVMLFLEMLFTLKLIIFDINYAINF